MPTLCSGASWRKPARPPRLSVTSNAAQRAEQAPEQVDSHWNTLVQHLPVGAQFLFATGRSSRLIWR